MASSEEVVSNTVKSDSAEHPWPFLEKLFKFESTEGKTYRFTCLLCRPKRTTCSAYHNSPSNLKKHIERLHPTHVEEYEKLSTAARKRKAENDKSCESVKKTSQPPIHNAFLNANMVTQSAVDNSILNLVVGGVLPLHIVEVPEFMDLITVLQPNRHATSRATLKLNIVSKAKQMKENLVAVLKEQSFVATTTDCWSSYGKSYIGVTVHWIDTDLKRQSACLALRRMTGSHTFDVIAAVLEDIHTQYGIRRKIVRTTTDNGSNFVKAFSVFADHNNSNDITVTDEDTDDDDIEEVDVFDVSDALSASDHAEYHLPRHQRCACHTLNLISTHDAESAESDASYKKVSRAAFAKCQALWNKYGRSALAVDTVMEAFSLGLKRPNSTRWNSVFFAVERLLRLIDENGEDAFNSVCNKLDVPRVTPTEVTFLTEYVSVMRPFVQALNILQGENNMFMGYLAPTIFMLREKLTEKLVSARTCKPLIKALVDGIDARFAYVNSDMDVIAAAIIHPKFKANWTENKSLIDSGIQVLII